MKKDSMTRPESLAASLKLLASEIEQLEQEEDDFERLEPPLEEDKTIESESNMFVGHERSPPKVNAKFKEATETVEIGCGPDNEDDV